MIDIKRFVASYSGGKDSILAIHRAIDNGLKPIKLLTTFNTEKKRSWFHGIPENILEKVSNSINIPISSIHTTGEKYADNMEKALLIEKNNGAEICVFGDIDIEDHRKWCTDICKKVGIEAYFPLWKINRKDIVFEFLDKGYKAIITVIDKSRMDKKYIGKQLEKSLLLELEKEGTDICGENGEYHTFTTDGPLFKKKIEVYSKEIIEIDNYIINVISL